MWCQQSLPPPWPRELWLPHDTWYCTCCYWRKIIIRDNSYTCLLAIVYRATYSVHFILCIIINNGIGWWWLSSTLYCVYWKNILATQHIGAWLVWLFSIFWFWITVDRVQWKHFSGKVLMMKWSTKPSDSKESIKDSTSWFTEKHCCESKTFLSILKCWWKIKYAKKIAIWLRKYHKCPIWLVCKLSADGDTMVISLQWVAYHHRMCLLIIQLSPNVARFYLKSAIVWLTSFYQVVS